MPDIVDVHAHVMRLLEEAIDSGRTPDEVCIDHPELLADVRQRWERCHRVEAELGKLFPSTGQAAGGRGTPAPPQLPGYRIGSVLGRGGVGVVYRATHLRLGRPVAVKVLLGGAHAGRVTVARFLREARAVAGLHHPNLVQVFDCGEHQGLPFYTMELVEGGTLADRLANTPQPAAATAALVAVLADAVEVAHRGGIVHRDLKPSNILLTAEGTPKVSDFGLARTLGETGDGEAGEALTLTGARIGTPSYMAPEQAGGRPAAVGPPADVYALGAVLYEMLAGRPPFRGESAADTERQVLAVDPVPPSRLNPRVPRDLETVCLACLRKDPARRYPTAAALADDLRRFGRGEPVTARRTGPVERAAKWVRRRPVLTTAGAGGGLAAVGLLAAGLWLASQRAAASRAADQDLSDAVAAQRRSAWAESNAALDRAAVRLGDGGTAERRRRLAEGRRDAALVARLDAIHMGDAATVGGVVVGGDEADRQYARAFADAGLGTDATDAAEVARRVAASPVRAALVAALDDWTWCAHGRGRREWMLRVARSADSDPAGWRDRIRSAILDRDWGPLDALAAAAPIRDEPTSSLTLFAKMLMANGRDAAPFLGRAQRAHPDDFWINEMLANELTVRGRRAEALGYDRAAVALRPDGAMAVNNLGSDLQVTGQIGAAIDAYRSALRLDPTASICQFNLGGALANQGQYADALPLLAAAARAGPAVAGWWSALGDCLAGAGRDGEAADAYAHATAADPASGRAWQGLRAALARQGRWPDLLRTWPAPPGGKFDPFEQWSGRAEFLADRDRPDDFRRAAVALLDRFGQSNDPRVCERVGRACLLLPAVPPAVLRRATACIDRAVTLDRGSGTFLPFDQLAKSLAEYRAGRPASALALAVGPAAGVPGPLPAVVAAMAAHRLGRDAEARPALARALFTFDCGPARAVTSDDWMDDALCREATSTVFPDLTAAVVDGSGDPPDDAGRAALFGVRRARGRNAAAARTWASIGAADPDALAGVTGDSQMIAARAAAAAVGGLGHDVGPPEPTDRAQLRAQACQWLTAVVRRRTSRFDRGTADDRMTLDRELRSWQVDPELSALRDPAALDRLTPDERGRCQALWAAVAALADRPVDPD